MADRSRNLTVQPPQTPAGAAMIAGPAYATIEARIRQSIAAGALPDGTVLLEGPLAALFGSSRSPVKRALAALEDEGLLSRFDGRGLLVGNKGIPRRVKIVPDMLLLDGEDGISAKSFAWQPHYYDFEREIILRSVFGRARVNELALARHLEVSRTVARDLLIHAREVGIVYKDDGSRWWIVPLDEARFENLYELRILLEPVAMTSAIGRIPDERLDRIEARLLRAQQRFPRLTVGELDLLEADLHIDCLGHGSNPEIAETLKRSHCILVAGKHIQLALGAEARVDPFTGEHLEILAALRAQDPATVRETLVRHLELSAQKAVHRLAAFRSKNNQHKLPYILET
ncbi:MAG: FCD domain-containing protein [Paracoccus sp. (in: a-proteobacteria)]|uniref:GntR family transcriptional regulator n=1 Tax=Paracoccus sp. TaxID=267 RepID=UPI0039E31B25